MPCLREVALVEPDSRQNVEHLPLQLMLSCLPSKLSILLESPQKFAS